MAPLWRRWWRCDAAVRRFWGYTRFDASTQAHQFSMTLCKSNIYTQTKSSTQVSGHSEAPAEPDSKPAEVSVEHSQHRAWPWQAGQDRRLTLCGGQKNLSRAPFSETSRSFHLATQKHMCSETFRFFTFPRPNRDSRKFPIGVNIYIYRCALMGSF